MASDLKEKESPDQDVPAVDDSPGDDSAGDEAPERLDLSIDVDSLSACQRHITVTIPRADIERYYDNAYSELVTTAEVPGFRSGRAPRKLVESRFKKEVTEQIKGSLLMDSMAQVNDDASLAAISEPDIDVDAIEIPAEGPMTFEFDLEVRPDFDLPEWRGIAIDRPTAEFTDEDVDGQLALLVESHGRLVPHDGTATTGDYAVVNLQVRDGDTVVSEANETTICIRPTLSFPDARLEKFDTLMKGATAGDKKEANLTLSGDAPNVSLRGKEVAVTFDVLEIKKFQSPEFTSELLEQLGDFESEADLRDTIRDSLSRQLEYEQQQRARQQVTKQLTEAAEWELPQELLERQSRRELERAVLELRRSGFSEADIRAHENRLRQNSQASTATALREHFILERIAEEEDIDATDDDFNREITLIARQSGDTPRRVRAQLEKGDLMDALRNQVIERKVVERVLADAKFKDVPYTPPGGDIEAIDFAAGGGDDEQAEIPEAMHADAGALAEPKDRT